MANKEFDFKKLKDTKVNLYLKEYCKLKDVVRAKGGIVFTDYRLAGKKQSCVFIPILKLDQAAKIFKQIKEGGEHILQKTAFVSVDILKKEKKVNLTIKKGGLSAKKLNTPAVQKFFQDNLSLSLKVIEGKEDTKGGSAPKQKMEEKESSAPSLEKFAISTKKTFSLFKQTLLPSIQSNSLDENQKKQLEKVSKEFEEFNQQYSKSNKTEQAKHTKLMQVVQKAAALIAKVNNKKTGKGSDIIDGDNIFSADEKAAIQKLVKEIKTGLPLVKSQVIPNLKANKTTGKDKQVIGSLIDNIARFNDNYEAAPAPVQKKLGKFLQTVNKQQKQLQQILKKLDAKAQENLSKILTPEQRKEVMNTAKNDVAQIMKDLDEMNSMIF